MVIQFTIISILYIVALWLTGRCKAITDLIDQHDALKYKGTYYTREFMWSTKDRNKDGKITFWESSFPKDGWHKAERWRTVYGTMINTVLAYSIATFFVETTIQFVLGGLLVLAAGWLVPNISFEHYYKGVLKGKQLI